MSRSRHRPSSLDHLDSENESLPFIHIFATVCRSLKGIEIWSKEFLRAYSVDGAIVR